MKFLLATVLALPSVLGDGIQFSRTIDTIADDSSLLLKIDSGCSSSDDHGSNDCSFAWGDEVSGSVDLSLGHDLGEGSTFSVNMKVDSIVPFAFSCPVCGANCTTTVPIVNQDVNFAMPPCPVSALDLSTPFDYALPADSPTKGVKVSAKGTLGVKDAAGDTVLSGDLTVTVQ
ncbi:hypothetical protein TrCOL_g11638 [Triparma columacea]|uniref:Uncharacterized protein n=1 Tax=Triparma columacea TaxID=722753 RepID=A0A9W7LGN0_9STRA|nr:hypothetical protein TrCOL_g11638 [Triparma columacea]